MLTLLGVGQPTNGAGGPPPVETFFMLTPNGDFMTTPNGDFVERPH